MAHRMTVDEGLSDCYEKKSGMAAWLVSKNTLQVLPQKHLSYSVGPHDALIRIKAVGICGTDLHMYKTSYYGDYFIKEPMVLGHECAGIVEKIGNEVKHLAAGDPVALEPLKPCRLCNVCKRGHYNACSQKKTLGLPLENGALATHIVHPSDQCFKLPENVSMEEGAMCEPLSVAVNACRKAGVGPDTNVLILGAGSIGLATLMAVLAYGAPHVVITGSNHKRLSVAKSLGAHHTVHVSRNSEDIDEEVKNIKEAMGGDIDVSIDCAGFSKTMSTAIKATTPGGKVCLVGYGDKELTTPLMLAAAKKVDILGCFAYNNTWHTCLQLIKARKVNMKARITHEFGFSQTEVEEAFRISSSGNAIKVVIKP